MYLRVHTHMTKADTYSPAHNLQTPEGEDFQLQASHKEQFCARPQTMEIEK